MNIQFFVLFICIMMGAYEETVLVTIITKLYRIFCLNNRHTINIASKIHMSVLYIYKSLGHLFLDIFIGLLT